MNLSGTSLGRRLTGISVESGNVELNGPVALSRDGTLAVVANGTLTIRGSVTGEPFSVLYLYGSSIRFDAGSVVDVDIVSQFEGATTFNGQMTRGNLYFGSLPPFPRGYWRRRHDRPGGRGKRQRRPESGRRGSRHANDRRHRDDRRAPGDRPDRRRADRLAVHGTVRLGSQLQVTAALGLTLPANGAYTLIDNDGTDPVVGTFQGLPQGATVISVAGTPLFINYRGGDGNDVELTAQPPGRTAVFAVGAGPGGGPQVNVYSADGSVVRRFAAYDPGFRGGVRVATADLNGDGIVDVVTVPGAGGGPHVRVFSGADGGILREFMAFDPRFLGRRLRRGGDVTGDGMPDIVVGAGAGGGPHVKAFDGVTGAVVRSFFAYDAAFRGGVTVAVGDTTGTVTPTSLPGPGPAAGRTCAFSTCCETWPCCRLLRVRPRVPGGVFVAAFPGCWAARASSRHPARAAAPTCGSGSATGSETSPDSPRSTRRSSGAYRWLSPPLAPGAKARSSRGPGRRRAARPGVRRARQQSPDGPGEPLRIRPSVSWGSVRRLTS